MYKLKSIAQLASSLMIMILLVVSFFNWPTIVQAALPDCGPFQIIGTCNNGTAKQLPDSLNPLVHNWTCETLGNPPINCSSAGTPRTPTGSSTPTPSPTPSSTPITLPPGATGTAGTGVFTPAGTLGTPAVCANPLTSNWANLDQVNIPCCGYLDDKWVDTQVAGRMAAGKMTATAMCSTNNSGAAKDIKATQTDVTWTCGVATCKAYKIPSCATEVSEVAINDCSINNPTDSTRIYKDKKAFDDAIDARVKSGRDQFCNAGNSLVDSCLSTLVVGSAWRQKNTGYVCTNTKPGGTIADTKMVRCVAGWSVPSQCGKAGKEIKLPDARYDELVSLLENGKYDAVQDKWSVLSVQEEAAAQAELDQYNGKIYAASNPLDKDQDLLNFFNLSAEADAALELCPKGSKAINKSYKFQGVGLNSDYWPDDVKGDKPSDYEGLGSLDRAINFNRGNYYYEALSLHYKKSFNWQCQQDDDRDGAVVDCEAMLTTDGSGDKLAKCGPAINGRFAYPGAGPSAPSEFCSFGHLQGTPEYDMSIDRNSLPPTWKWRCIANKAGADGKVAYEDCSVAASVYCGAAANKIYSNQAAVVSAGPCVGDVLTADNIYKGRNTWDWTCHDAKDKTVSVACSAGNDTGKCGYADRKSYQISTFDNNKATKDFLCYGTLTATSLGNQSKSLPSEWNWTCGEEKCSATVLECGQGNLGYYTERDFYANRYNYPAFMCSNGNVAVREWRASDDLGGAARADGYDPGWFWSCEGNSVKPGVANDKLAYGSCMAREYQCGYLQGYSVKKSLFDSYKDAYDHGDADKNDYFCTYDMRVTDFTRDGQFARWQCANPNPESPYQIDCSVRHPQCGTFVDSGQSYSKAKLEEYLWKNLNEPLNPKGHVRTNYEALCRIEGVEVPPTTITDDGQGNLTWTCGGSPTFSTLMGINQADNTEICSVKKGAPEGNCNDSVGYQEWQRFYKDYFAIDIDLSQVQRPDNSQSNLKFLEYIPKNLTYQQVHAVEKAKYPKYNDDPANWLDLVNWQAEERTNNAASYAIYHSGSYEADTIYGNVSANWIASHNVKTLTRMEVGIFKLFIYWKCGKLTDMTVTTYATGSRTHDNLVPTVGWSNNQLNSALINPDQANLLLRPRPVLAL